MSTTPPPDIGALSPLAEQLATTIARVSSDIALVIDEQGVIASVAEGTQNASSARAGWVGQRWIDTVSSSTRGKIQSLLDEASAGGVTRRRQVNHPGENGDDIPITWAAIRLGAEGPLLAVGRDLRTVAAIQQRFVEAQQDMERHYWHRRQSETRYQLLFQVASDAVLVLDAAGMQVIEANAAARDVLGVDGSSIQGCPLPECLPVGPRAAVAQLLLNARSTGRAGEIRVRSLGGSGAVAISATPFRAGEQQQLLVRARRDELGGAGDRELERMAEFVETTPDAVVVTDSAGCILMANPAFVRLTRQADETRVRGKGLPELLFDANGAWARLIARTRTTGIVPSATLDVGAADAHPEEGFNSGQYVGHNLGHTGGLGGGFRTGFRTVSLTVQVTAALMTQGEQACIGLILRPGARAPTVSNGSDLLAGLTEQVGRVPLADLLVEVTHRAERQLIQAALEQNGGLRSVAADALGLTPEALALRIQRHGLSSTETGALFAPKDPPHSIN